MPPMIPIFFSLALTFVIFLLTLILINYSISESIIENIEPIDIISIRESDNKPSSLKTVGRAEVDISIRVSGSRYDFAPSPQATRRCFLAGKLLPEKISVIKRFLDGWTFIVARTLLSLYQELRWKITLFKNFLHGLINSVSSTTDNKNFSLTISGPIAFGSIASETISSVKTSYESKLGFKINAPTRVFKNNSETIRLDIWKDEPGILYPEEAEIRAALLEAVTVEARILASALNIEGELVQRASLHNGHHCFQWNCCFDHSGKHQITFEISLRTRNGVPISLQTKDGVQMIKSINHKFRVVTFLWLTELQLTQLSLGGGFLAFLGLMLQVLEIMNTLQE